MGVNRSSGNCNLELDSYYSKMCSHDFVEEKQTLLNTYPTLHVGHSDVVKQGRALPKEREDPSLARKKGDFWMKQKMIVNLIKMYKVSILNTIT